MPTGSADVPISHLAWSPRHNILAWTDMEGSLTRHNNVIPSSFASPIKVSASTTARSVTMRQRAAPTLFDDDEVANDKETSGDADLDIASGDAAVDTLADFLDDDLGEYLKDDEEAEAKFRSGRVEVGQ
jgi:chromosome transmission fidelity protein 4